MISVRFGFHKVIYKRVQFSQKNNLESLCQAKVSTFKKIKLIAFHDAGFWKFENSQLSFGNSHKLGVILFLIKNKN
jgi:hypothetical protein